MLLRGIRKTEVRWIVSKTTTVEALETLPTKNVDKTSPFPDILLFVCDGWLNRGGFSYFLHQWNMTFYLWFFFVDICSVVMNPTLLFHILSAFCRQKNKHKFRHFFLQIFNTTNFCNDNFNDELFVVWHLFVFFTKRER